MSPLLTALLPFLFLGSVFSTVAGGGLGVILLVIGSLFLPVQQNIAIMSVLSLGIQATKFLHFYKHTDWQVAGWFLVLGVPAAVLGGWLLFVLPAQLIERCLGLVMLITVIRDFVPRWRMTLKPTRMTLLLSGGLNGLIGGIIGNASTMRGQIFLALGLSKAQFVATAAAAGLPINIAKSAVYVTQIAWSHEIGLLFLFGIPLMILGVWLGKYVLEYVSIAMFELLQRIMILVGAIKFLLF